jgi:hypothetical protein
VPITENVFPCDDVSMPSPKVKGQRLEVVEIKDFIDKRKTSTIRSFLQIKDFFRKNNILRETGRPKVLNTGGEVQHQRCLPQAWPFAKATGNNGEKAKNRRFHWHHFVEIFYFKQ